MNEIEKAIEHFHYGITHDIFSEPVTTYARLTIDALREKAEREKGGRAMKIEKCPFCGKEVAEIDNCKNIEECEHFEECPAVEPYVCVVCNMHEGGCGASSGYYDSEAKAIAAWNHRANLGSCENELIVRCKNCKHY